MLRFLEMDVTVIFCKVHQSSVVFFQKSCSSSNQDQCKANLGKTIRDAVWTCLQDPLRNSACGASAYQTTCKDTRLYRKRNWYCLLWNIDASTRLAELAQGLIGITVLKFVLAQEKNARNEQEHTIVHQDSSFDCNGH